MQIFVSCPDAAEAAAAAVAVAAERRTCGNSDADAVDWYAW